MKKTILSFRRIGFGVLLGEALLVLGIMDGVRARAMGGSTEVDPAWWTRPLATVVGLASSPVFAAGQKLFGQEPIPIFMLWLVYWGALGAALFHVPLIVRRTEKGIVPRSLEKEDDAHEVS